MEESRVQRKAAVAEAEPQVILRMVRTAPMGARAVAALEARAGAAAASMVEMGGLTQGSPAINQEEAVAAVLIRLQEVAVGMAK